MDIDFDDDLCNRITRQINKCVIRYLGQDETRCCTSSDKEIIRRCLSIFMEHHPRYPHSKRSMYLAILLYYYMVVLSEYYFSLTDQCLQHIVDIRLARRVVDYITTSDNPGCSQIRQLTLFGAIGEPKAGGKRKSRRRRRLRHRKRWTTRQK